MLPFLRNRSVRIVERFIDAVNRRDLDGVGAVISDDFRIVDSQGEWLEGRDEVLRAHARFFELEPNFNLSAESKVARGDEVLVKGSVTASDPSLALDTLWKARVAGDKVTYFQSFGPPEAPHLARALAGDAAHPSSESAA